MWALLGWFSTTVTLSSVTDGTNSYTIDRQGRNFGVNFAVCSADCPAGITNPTITATFSATVPDRKIAAMYSSGVVVGGGATYGAVSNGQTTGATNWTSTATAVTNGDILIGGSHWEDSVQPTNTASGGNTEVHDWNDGVSGSAATSCFQIGTGASIAAQGTWSTGAGAPNSGIFSVAVAYSAITGNLVGGPVGWVKCS